MRYNNLENKTYDKIEINRKNNLHNKGAASNSAPHEIIPSTIGTMVEGLSIYNFPFSYPHTSPLIREVICGAEGRKQIIPKGRKIWIKNQCTA